MKTTIRIILSAVTLFLLAACQQTAEPEASIDLAGTNWVLSSLNGELPVTGTAVTLEFGTDGTAFGTDGCNRFNTTYTQDGSSLTINQSTGISTMMACEEPVMNQATAYMTALNETTSFTASGNQLSLLNGDEVLATFVAGTEDATDTETETSMSLSDTSWVLSSLSGELPISGTAVTLQFNADGTATGTDGCNQYTTTYTQDGNSLTINQAEGATTMMACPEPVMEQATAFNAALSATNSFIMTENELFLQDGDQILATFVLNSTDLTDTAWDVVNYNNGRDAVVGLVVGTELSANFGIENDLTGSAGCNQYFTTFTANDGTIEIGTIGSSMRFCIDPPGIMEQEAEYLAALQSATTYSIQGNMLQMRTADDQLAVVMARKLLIDLPEPPEPTVATGRITGAPQGVNVRSGPGVNFPIIGLAQNGDKGEIVGRSADNLWWAASIPSAPNGMGWVSADFVIATNTQDVPVIEVPPPVIVVPTAAPTPTPLPLPTATPTPQISFSGNPTTIEQGQCATLTWSVENIQAVWVYPQGERFERFPRTGQGSEQVCPTSTTTYEMRVQQLDGSTVFRQVTITVTGVANPLSGTRWEVVNYNNGQGGVVTLLSDTRISLDFSAEGQLSGNAGCNNYFSSYQVNGNNISISLPGSTAQFCAEPEGIMDQESAYLAILPAATTFQINGNSLEMRTAGGQIAVVANRVP